MTSVLIVTIAVGVDGANQDTNGYFGEPPNEPIQLQLGPNPLASMNQQFEVSLSHSCFDFSQASNFPISNFLFSVFIIKTTADSECS